MSDHGTATIARPGQLRIAGQAEPVDGEVSGFITTSQVRPLRAPVIPAATLVQLLFGLMALGGLFVTLLAIASVLLAVGVTCLVAGLVGVVLSALREAGRI